MLRFWICRWRKGPGARKFRQPLDAFPEPPEGRSPFHTSIFTSRDRLQASDLHNGKVIAEWCYRGSVFFFFLSFWMLWVFMAFMRAFSSCSKWGLLLAAVLVPWLLSLWSTGSRRVGSVVTLWHVEVSQTRYHHLYCQVDFHPLHHQGSPAGDVLSHEVCSNLL